MNEPQQGITRNSKPMVRHVLTELTKPEETNIDENGKIIPVWIQAENEILREEIKNANK